MGKVKSELVCQLFVTLLVLTSVQADIKDKMRNSVSFKLTELIRKLFPVDEKADQTVLQNIVPNLINGFKNFIYPPSTTFAPTTTEQTESTQTTNQPPKTDDPGEQQTTSTSIASTSEDDKQATSEEQTVTTEDQTTSTAESINIESSTQPSEKDETDSTVSHEEDKTTETPEGETEETAETEAEGSTTPASDESTTASEEGDSDSTVSEEDKTTETPEGETEETAETEAEGSTTPASDESTTEMENSTLSTTTLEPIEECTDYAPPPPALRKLYEKLKPHLNVSSHAAPAERKKYPSYRKLMKDITKIPVSSSSFSQKVKAVISGFQSSIDESVDLQRKYFEATHVNMLFKLKNHVQKLFNKFTDLVSRSLRNSGVCNVQSQACWDKLNSELPRFMDDMNQEIVTCDVIFNANIENPQGTLVRKTTVDRIGKEYNNIQAKCLTSGQSNDKILACLMKNLPYYVPRSAAYYGSLENAVNQGTNLMGYVTNMAESCYDSAYSTRTQLFNNGMTKLNACVQGESSSDVQLHQELDK